MPAQPCTDAAAHGPHEWYWKNILRRECPGLTGARRDELEEMTDAIIAAHNKIYHPGQDCPTEDENGACATRTGEPVVLTWTDSGVRRHDDW